MIATPRCIFLLLVTVTMLCAGCVSRNVETIDGEEAATIPVPPPPSESGARPSVASLPGVQGTVNVDPTVGAIPEGVLYIIVRVSGRDGGPPLAVKPMAAEVPASFNITEADSMIPGTPLIGDLDIIARLDQDGDAFSRQEGDLEGRAGPVQVGAAVDIVLRPAPPPAE
ncbi:MAG TPA: hypothetical protein QGG47_12545 [Acidobacteriota bacterium]|nr:hypothetical protein [Acidobacteriota bacterium]